MTGDVISHFEILETLGEGGMGVVYRARDTKLDRTVAIKFLPSGVLRSDVDRQRFAREARAAANLTHPNICTVYEYDEVDGQALIAMECVDGKTLQERIQERDITRDEAMRIAGQVASGLAAAHKRGIVHRDIKPGNVLLTEDGIAKISDFGLAKFTQEDAVTRTGRSVGTIAYMSPEQARGDTVGPQTDVWSLGVVLLEMLTGEHPFKSEYPTAALYSIVNEEPRGLDRLETDQGDEIAALIRRCLEKEPDARPSAGEVAALLLPDGGATGTQVAYQAPRALPWKLILAGGAAVVVIALAILFVPGPRSAAHGLQGATLAVLPVVSQDSALKVTLDGLLQTVATSMKQRSGGFGRGPMLVPFSDAVDEQVATPRDAQGKLGAEYSIVTRISGYDPVPTMELTLVRARDNEVIGSETVPVLLNDLEDSYEAAFRRVGSLIGLPDSLLIDAKPSRKTNPEVFQLYTRAMGLLQQRSSERSLEAAQLLLERALSLDPDFASIHAAMGQADLSLFEMTRDLDLLDQAERHCDAAMRLEPDLIQAYVTLARVQSYTGKLGQAQRAVETALDREPFNMDALLVLADVQADLGHFDLAEQTFKKAISSNPDYWVGYSRLGKFYFERSEWSKASEQYQKVIDLAPMSSASASGYRNLGSMMYMAGKTEEAIRDWQFSIEIEPSYTAYNNIGTVRFYEGNYKEAAAAYRKALEINDKDHRVWSHLATAYYWMGADRTKYEAAKRKALEMAEHWLEVNPTDMSVKAQVAAYYAELNEAQKSRALLEEFGTRPDSELTASISFDIGAAWEVLGERAKALLWIRDALLKGQSVNEVTQYPGLEDLRTDRAFIRIMDSLRVDSASTN